MCVADLPPLQGVHFSPGGEYIAAHSSDGGKVMVWHAATGKAAASFGRHKSAVLSLCWLSDTSFATCGQDGAVHINRVRLLPLAATGGPGPDVIMSEGGHQEGQITVAWERNIHVYEGHVNEISASSDAAWLAVACDDGGVRVWRTVRLRQSMFCAYAS